MDAALRRRLLEETVLLLDYLAVSDGPGPSDIIWALGSHEPRVAERAAELFNVGWAPWLVCSGGRGHRWSQLERSEAETFAEIARARGVPATCILVEPRSTNTAENIQYSSALLHDRGIQVRRALLVTIPPFQRRAWLTARTHRPDIECLNCPGSWGPPDEWDDDQLILAARLCAGEIRRLREYPARGFLVGAPAVPGIMVTRAAAIEAHVPEF